MYKKITSVFLALLMLLSLCACRRKDPAEISESFAGTPVVTEEPQATSAPTAAPDNSTPSPRPTLNWVESEDGQSITATISGHNGSNAEVQIGIATGDETGDLPTGGTISTPTPTESPAHTTAPTEAPDTPQAPITVWTGPATDTTLAEYEAMSGEEQMLFYYSFANAEDFTAWYNAAKEAHDAAQDYIEIGGDDVINLG